MIEKLKKIGYYILGIASLLLLLLVSVAMAYKFFMDCFCYKPTHSFTARVF